MIEIFIDTKWAAINVMEKTPSLRGFLVMFEPEDKGFHALLALNNQVVQLRMNGWEYAGVLRIDRTPVFEANSVEFCRASISKEVS